MLPLRKLLIAVPVLAAAFLAGYWLRPSGAVAPASQRKPLYYVDPMHPAYKSDKPGIAPDCGMQLEPVYADGPAPQAAPGAVRISLEKQQLMGLKTARIGRTSGSHTLRLLGRVAADETRIHRVTALIEGVVRSVSSQAAGSLVQKDDLLATYFVSLREVYNAVQTFLAATGATDQRLALGQDPTVMDTSKAEIRLAEELLRQYGMTEAQMMDLVRSRQITRDIEFRSPVTGLILSRTVSLDQRLEKGAELFRIADLNRVWVFADLFENEAGLVHRGSAARVLYRGQTYKASVIDARQFDPGSRTLKLRLEIDNPGLLLRPDMFVDVEFDVNEPEGISVPVDALLDLGRRRAVFVSTGDGAFEPREVTTGARYGERVQILKGLDEGENVVVSGLFLLDSESRLQLAASGAARAPKPAAAAGANTDPVCGMAIDPSRADFHSEFEGATYHFCSKDCKAKFDREPSRYAPRMPPDSMKDGQS